MQAKAGLAQDRTLDELLETGSFIVGSPATVRQKLIDAQRAIGFGNLLLTIQFGTLPHDLTLKNIRLLGSQVVPQIKAHAAAVATVAG
jgi:alkanesulfonate monooxygenase SsuD/methylene tetrahydromethanopterin reductase-like flavin-dependent oxidoreductase (luciferase family)